MLPRVNGGNGPFVLPAVRCGAEKCGSGMIIGRSVRSGRGRHEFDNNDDDDADDDDDDDDGGGCCWDDDDDGTAFG